MHKQKPTEPRVLRLICHRKERRQSAVLTALELVTWPTGKYGREEVERLLSIRLRHLRKLYRSPYDEIVINIIKRRALTVYHERQQQENPT